MRSLKFYGPLLVILVLAAFTRWFDIGKEYLDGDHAYIAIQAMNVARSHALPLLGPPMAVGMWHSPVSIYLYAIPFLFSTDARLARAFTGLLNIIGIILLYVVGYRYFGWKTAAVAALLYAVQPEMVVAGRAINNAQLGAPFAVGFLLTGLLGFYENRRVARWLCLPLLSLAGQCHPYTFALLPVTGVLVGYAWFKFPLQRRIMLVDVIGSGLAATVLMLPWAIGFYQFAPTKNFQSVAPNMFTNQGLEFTLRALYAQIGGPGETGVTAILPWMFALGTGWLLLRAFKSDSGFPGLVAVLSFFVMPVIVVLLKLHLVTDYFWPTFPIAFLILGAFVGGVIPALTDTGWLMWNGLLNDKYLRWVGGLALVVVMAAYLRFFFTHDRSDGLVPLNQQINALDLALNRASATQRDVLIVTGSDYDDYMPWEMLSQAYRLAAQGDTRVIHPDRAMPLPEKGAVLIGPANFDGQPDLFKGGQIVFDTMRLTDLPPASQFQPGLQPLHPLRLSNGATILGAWTANSPSQPSANTSWRIYIIWRVDALAETDQTLYVHLVNSAGDKYAQQDVQALPSGEQRLGETVINQINLQLGKGLPDSGPLFLRVGMYSNGQQAKLVDDAGNMIGDFGLIQIRGEATLAATWPNGLALDQLSTNSPVIQGPPLDVQATWLAQTAQSGNLRVRWRLLNDQAQQVFMQDENVLPGADETPWAQGVFTSQHYLFRIPTDIPPGSYQLDLSPLDAQGTPLDTAYQSKVEVTARERHFEAPVMAHTVGATYADALKLLGYDAALQGRALQLVLHWQALGQITQDYKYFVHVWKDNSVVAQVDSVPGDYGYYTSWWAPNEVYNQNVQLDLSSLSSGRYTLTSGFYNPDTGQRLAVHLADGSQPANQWVTLQEIELP